MALPKVLPQVFIISINPRDFLSVSDAKDSALIALELSCSLAAINFSRTGLFLCITSYYGGKYAKEEVPLSFLLVAWWLSVLTVLPSAPHNMPGCICYYFKKFYESYKVHITLNPTSHLILDSLISLQSNSPLH